jgi:hypothetical protein
MTSSEGAALSDGTWWYEWNGRQAGPVAEPALLELVRSGLLRPTARVWRAGMSGWEEVARVPELAAAVPAAPSRAPVPPATDTERTSAPDPGAAREQAAGAEAGAGTGSSGAGPAAESPRLPPEGGGWAPPPAAPGPGAAWASPLPAGMEPTSTAAVIGLGIVTLGIYPMIKFYQAALAYETLAGRRSRFTVYFWLSVGLAVAGGPLHVAGGLLGFAAHVGALVFTILTLFEVLAVRAELCRRQAIAPSLTPDGTHKALFIIGIFTSWLALGVVLLLVQAVKFFHDHRAIGDALRARATPAALATGAPSSW